MNTTLPLAAVTALAAWSLAGTAAAPDPASPVSEAVRTSAGRAATNFIAAAKDMPAAQYGFKPTPAQMSFGEAIAHMAGGNDALCSSIGGVAAPKRAALAAGAPKEELVARLEETFRFCESALARVDDSRLGEKVPYFGEQSPRAAVMVSAAEEWAGHYSQIAVYLRLNGLVPPTAKPRAAQS
jgi:DinB superfamily